MNSEENSVRKRYSCLTFSLAGALFLGNNCERWIRVTIWLVKTDRIPHKDFGFFHIECVCMVWHVCVLESIWITLFGCYFVYYERNFHTKFLLRNEKKKSKSLKTYHSTIILIEGDLFFPNNVILLSIEINSIIHIAVPNFSLLSNKLTP